jgi:hypothetical protein
MPWALVELDANRAEDEMLQGVYSLHACCSWRTHMDGHVPKMRIRMLACTRDEHGPLPPHYMLDLAVNYAICVPDPHTTTFSSI